MTYDVSGVPLRISYQQISLRYKVTRSSYHQIS